MTISPRFLGIDYGTKRIGLAVSAENNRLAFPKEIISNDADTFNRISEILKQEKISEIVIGESVDFSGKPNALSAQIEIFILKLKKEFGLPVHKQKEFLTSVEARRYFKPARRGIKQTKSDRIDAGAAALILQRYLDRKNLALSQPNKLNR